MTPGQLARLKVLRTDISESLLSVDRMVRTLVDILRERAVLDRTVIAFTSDNGLMLGEHRFLTKVWPYEESIRVPLIVRTPWTEAASTDHHLVLNIDIAPTLADLAGIIPPGPIDGRSFADLLRGRSPPGGWRSAFVVESLAGGPKNPPSYEGLRTNRYLYVEYGNGWQELYDLAEDPYELANRADDPNFRPIEDELASQLQAFLRRSPARGTSSP